LEGTSRAQTPAFAGESAGRNHENPHFGNPVI